ncbi:MAG: oligosaccharide flippase family protein [Melioribacteraceae bacterium]|nr:oligosaccharide flippase family protein [Melioribacteraceae bacterium]
MGDILTFVLFVSISRQYGQEGIGQYSFAMAVTGFFAVLADFGLYQFTIKTISRDLKIIKQEFFGIIITRIIISALVFGLLLIGLYFYDTSEQLKLVIAIIGLYQIVYTIMEGIGVIFIVHEEMHFVGIFELTTKLLIAIIGILLIVMEESLISVILIYPIITIIQIGIIFIIARWKYGKFMLVFNFKDNLVNLKKSISLLSSSFVNMISMRVDVIMLGFILTVTTVGIYNASYRIVFVFMMFANFFSLALFPQFSKMYKDSGEKLIKLVNNSLSSILLFSIPAAGGVFILAPKIIDLIYGNEFSDSSVILQYLTGIILLYFIERILSILLVSVDKEVLRMKCQWIVGIFNVITMVLFIKLFGIKGAAFSATISLVLLIAIYMYYLKTFINFGSLIKRIFICSVGTFAFCFAITFFQINSLVGSIILGSLIYCVIILFFKSIRNNELKMILDHLRNNSV